MLLMTSFDRACGALQPFSPRPPLLFSSQVNARPPFPLLPLLSAFSVFFAGDVNFATELSDLRHRHGFRIILVHSKSVSPALIACAHLSVSFEEVVKDVPPQGRIQTEPQPGEVWVDGLPLEVPLPSVRQRLMQLSCNCGGRVVAIAAGSALLRFSHKEAAQRLEVISFASFCSVCLMGSLLNGLC